MAIAATAKASVSPTILVVDDEPSMLRYLQTLLELDSYRVETARSGESALERLAEGPLPDVILLDMLMPGLDGLETLERIRSSHPDAKVVMLSCVGDTRKVVHAIRLGAFDYLVKPFQKADLETLITNCLQTKAVPKPEESSAEQTAVANEDIIELSEDVSFIARSPAMRRIHAQAARVAKYDVPILLLGESGTGKEVLAKLIHQLSTRSQRTFLKVNCAAVPAELLESELFGYEAGAFTGAAKAKPGKFEICDGGTILLDEIGEMAPALQAKLLGVLQDQQFSRLGSRTISKVDVRVLAATNIDVHQAIAAKQFRADLYYRLNGFSLQLPPLRERKEEIPVLLKHFISRFAENFAKTPRDPGPELLQVALAYPWPGNLRELENFARRFVILDDEEMAISEIQAGLNGNGEADAEQGLKSLARSVKNVAEADAISRALEQTNWHRQKAAALLKISYKALLYKIRQYELQPHR